MLSLVIIQNVLKSIESVAVERCLVSAYPQRHRLASFGARDWTRGVVFKADVVSPEVEGRDGDACTFAGPSA